MWRDDDRTYSLSRREDSGNINCLLGCLYIHTSLIGQKNNVRMKGVTLPLNLNKGTRGWGIAIRGRF